MTKLEGAQGPVPSLLLVRVKQEETDPIETLGRSKINKSGHPDQHLQVRRLLPQRECAFSESDCTSSGDERQPPPSPTSLPISNDVRIRKSSPSTAFSVSIDELNTANSVSTSFDAVNPGALTEANTSELPHPKHETEDSSYEKRTGNSEGGFRPCPDPSPPPRNHKCEICGDFFTRIGLLKRHVYFIHTYDTCESCGKAFPRSCSLLRHINTVHRSAQGNTCELCGKVFQQPRLLRRHVNGVHRKLREFACEICDKAFAHKSSLNQHIDFIHKELREFVCDICGKAFVQKQTLDKHIDYIHKALRPFACEICGRNFAEMRHLRDHINHIHKKLRPFACETCGATFPLKASLQKHIRLIHKNPRKRCEVCGEGFSCERDLRKHLDGVHRGLQMFTCVTCSKTFRRKQSLMEHVARSHNQISKE
ncbi:hypothetical protein SprV_0301001800 [Sparganum proliferum]